MEEKRNRGGYWVACIHEKSKRKAEATRLVSSTNFNMATEVKHSFLYKRKAEFFSSFAVCYTVGRVEKSQSKENPLLLKYKCV
jgi:hypothetical protein